MDSGPNPSVSAEALERMRASVTAVPAEALERMRASVTAIPVAAIEQMQASIRAVPVEALEQMKASLTAVPAGALEQIRASLTSVPLVAFEQVLVPFGMEEHGGLALAAAIAAPGDEDGQGVLDHVQSSTVGELALRIRSLPAEDRDTLTNLALWVVVYLVAYVVAVSHHDEGVAAGSGLALALALRQLLTRTLLLLEEHDNRAD
jgi:hypothetical protein